jgi:RNA polymerase sigma-70 factor, ECF subfamily
MGKEYRPSRDSGLIEQAARRDSDDIEQLYRQHSEAMNAAALRIVGSRMDADDVVHDVFASLPKILLTFDGRGAIGGWLHSVTVRRALMMLRSRRLRRTISLSPSSSMPDGSPGSHEASKLNSIDVNRAVATLPEDLRDVFVLKEVAGYTHEEVGEHLRISPGNAMVRLHRAKKKLRQMLGMTP